MEERIGSGAAANQHATLIVHKRVVRTQPCRLHEKLPQQGKGGLWSTAAGWRGIARPSAGTAESVAAAVHALQRHHSQLRWLRHRLADRAWSASVRFAV